jgi:hypothetical protein
MKLFTGSLAAGLVLLAAGAQAQVPYGNGRAPYAAVSDFDAPSAVAPDVIPGPRYGYGPSLLPSTEVYAVLRDNGFSPLGIPRLRGFVYTIAVIDRGGEDGRLIIDARNGRIVRFVPAYRMGGPFEESRVIHGPQGAPPPAHVMDSPQPPRPGPKVASRSVPIPKANPHAAKPAAPEPVKQAAAPAPKPAEVQAAAPPAMTTGSAPDKPVPQIAPTQEMPNPQGLE